MKSLQLLRNGAFGLSLMATALACSAPQNTTGAADLNTGELLERKAFVFIPQTMSPTGGRTRQVTPDFFFRVSGDTVQSYLPYAGRSYNAPMDPTRGGMDFNTTQFGYQVSKGKKEATNITIEPRSGTEARQITLQVFPNGNASLQAVFNNRQSISYNGRIQARR
ncbi:protein of unknown function [Cnuella takakiae]|uniref:DUF4251 domain-containing protein n=1 Tax=Cnuella takakiae TaxID=1302690 RepID=A0A1M5BCG2_9BACT|nr:DUF4251 domain-containing protein [Cnuella takakiae]OLY93431.1 hypothetical protein BUE76_17225 [Cnuella takakiae]SHF40219.1 protein of unknown function [Cnuella takakiae]